MERESTPGPTELTGIVINLQAQVIEFEDRYGTVGCLRFDGETVIYEGAPLLLAPARKPEKPSAPPTLPPDTQFQPQLADQT